MIDANTPLEKIAEMCNTMEDLRNLLLLREAIFKGYSELNTLKQQNYMG